MSVDVLTFAGVLIALTSMNAADCFDTPKCNEKCQGPWKFPFDAERTLYAVIPNDALAKAYRNKVLADSTLTIASRVQETYIFLNEHAANEFMQLYAFASEVAMNERDKYDAKMCFKLDDTACTDSYLKIENILNDDTLTEAEQCSKVKHLLCELTYAQRYLLRSLPPYRYRIERGQPFPTFAQAFHDMYGLHALNASMQQTALDLLERFKTEDMKFAAQEFTQWIATIKDEEAKAAATLQWYLYQFEHFPKVIKLYNFMRKEHLE